MTKQIDNVKQYTGRTAERIKKKFKVVNNTENKPNPHKIRTICSDELKLNEKHFWLGTGILAEVSPGLETLMTKEREFEPDSRYAELFIPAYELVDKIQDHIIRQRASHANGGMDRTSHAYVKLYDSNETPTQRMARLHAQFDQVFYKTKGLDEQEISMPIILFELKTREEYDAYVREQYENKLVTTKGEEYA